MPDASIEIESILRRELSPTVLEVVDFSAEHAGHSGNPTSSKRGTHIRVRIACSSFQGKSLLEQHRSVYSLLDPFLKKKGIHALELKTEEA
ncbi:BolA family transcriptional regulator [Leptospira langatensis]|uniref:BolA family transcriptional regulator n=1 Tax=Leptospira langatensis TaxID=2484983 RepID=A0A5F1ZYS6_9LEPT|nr:BolA family protein [Leptospira langatensis]TGK04309.1 BolA family transcriptional regulator [Leptospira langatensis]TGL43838.1 BolA family transcriptional regulator [Leptospira langatensis]